MIGLRLNLWFALIVEKLHAARLLSLDAALGAIEWARRGGKAGRFILSYGAWFALLIFGALASVGYGSYAVAFNPACRDQMPLSVAASMRDHPERWQRATSYGDVLSDHRLAHVSGLEVMLEGDYGSGLMAIGGVDQDHLSRGCRFLVRREGHRVLDSLLQREADEAAEAARLAVHP